MAAGRVVHLAPTIRVANDADPYYGNAAQCFCIACNRGRDESAQLSLLEGPQLILENETASMSSNPFRAPRPSSAASADSTDSMASTDTLVSDDSQDPLLAGGRGTTEDLEDNLAMSWTSIGNLSTPDTPGSRLEDWVLLDTDDYNWDNIVAQDLDNLPAPPPSPLAPLRRVTSLPTLSLPLTTIATLALLTLVPAAAATLVVPDKGSMWTIVPLPSSVLWIPQRPWPLWATVALILALVFWYFRTFCLSTSEHKSAELDIITPEDLVLLSYQPPHFESEAAIPMQRTKRSSGHTRSASMSSNGDLGPPTSLSSLPNTAAKVTTAVLMTAAAPTAAATSTGLPFGFVASPVNLATDNAIAPRRMLNPGAIAAIVLGIVLLPFVLLTLGRVFNIHLRQPDGRRMTLLRARLFRYACIAGGVTTGLAIGLVLTPVFAIYMLAVFVSAVTASYGRYAGLDTSNWWQGQAPQWPARMAAEYDTAQLSSISPSDTPYHSPVSRVDEKRQEKYVYSPEESPTDALPLPVYPAPIYTRSVGLVVLIALALPCVACPSAPHN